MAYREVNIASRNGERIHGWWLPASAKMPAWATVVFFHGNAENISTHIGSVHWLPAEGVNVLLVDYQGYGQSEGEAGVAAALADVDASLRYLTQQASQSRLPWFVYGQSLGASLAGKAVADGPRPANLAGIMLDAGFTAYGQIAQEVAARNYLTWPLQYPVSWLMPSEVDLVDAIAAISPLPLLLIHGRSDAVIPYRHVERLYAAASAPKELLSYEGGHIQTAAFPENRAAILDFMRRWAGQWQSGKGSGPGN